MRHQRVIVLQPALLVQRWTGAVDKLKVVPALPCQRLHTLVSEEMEGKQKALEFIKRVSQGSDKYQTQIAHRRIMDVCGCVGVDVSVDVDVCIYRRFHPLFKYE